MTLTPSHLIKSKISSLFFCENHLKDPVRFKEDFVARDFQRRIFNKIDLGYDPRYKSKPKIPPEWIIIKIPRQWGKSVLVSCYIVFVSVTNPTFNVGIVSINEERANEVLGKAKNLLLNSEFADMLVSSTKRKLILSNGSKVRSFPQSSGIRGTDNDLLIIDEGAKVEDEVIDSDASPTVDDRGRYQRTKRPDKIILSTPFGSNNRFYELYQIGLNKREIVCQDCDHRRSINNAAFSKLDLPPYTIPKVKCPKCGSSNHAQVSNEAMAVTVDPWNEHPRWTPEEIQRQLDFKGNSAAAKQEILAIFATEGSKLITEDLLLRSVKDTLKNVDKVKSYNYAMSGDFGKMRDATCFMIGHNEHNVPHLDYSYHKSAEDGESTYKDVRYTMLNLISRYQPHLLVLDGTGIGDPVVEQIIQDIYDLKTIGIHEKHMERGTVIKYNLSPIPKLPTRVYHNKKPKRVKGGSRQNLGFVFDYKSKKNLIENMVLSFEQGLIKIPSKIHIPIEWKELKAFGYKHTGGDRIIYGTQREHDDTVVTLAMLILALQEPFIRDYAPQLVGRSDYVL